MIKYILRQWSKRKATFILIIFSYFIGSLVLSIGISNCVSMYEAITDSNYGLEDDNADITISTENNTVIEKNTLDEVVGYFSGYGEIQILNATADVRFNGENVGGAFPVVPSYFEKSVNWHIPIVKGSYFNVDNMLNNDNVTVVGKEVAKNNKLDIGDTIYINETEYRIIGICGRENRGTGWESAIYIPYRGDLFSNLLSGYNNFTFMLHEGRDESIENAKDLEKYLEQNNIIFTIDSIEMAHGDMTSTLTLTILSSSLVFLIIIINITNLNIYWVYDRKKALSIMRAIGVTKNKIKKYMVLESVCMSIIGCCLALLVQLIIANLFEHVFAQNEIYIRITLMNYIVSCAVVSFVGIIAAIAPIKKVLKYKIAHIVNSY